MLRGTTEAMSAAIAGVHSIEVRPFDEAYEKPTDFSTRIARNVQLLLKEESHFNQVCDAAGGSYYIENLDGFDCRTSLEIVQRGRRQRRLYRGFRSRIYPGPDRGFRRDQR